MSRLAKIPVVIKEGVGISIDNGVIRVSGPKGNLSFEIPKKVVIKTEDEKLYVESSDKNINSTLGLTRAIVANMIKGVSVGFEKKLELSGVGYRASISGKDLLLSVGFSHPVKVVPELGINFLVKDNVITVSGIDKALVGNIASKIRNVRPAEPYKGKGIKYDGERIRRKAGKAAKAVGGK